MTRHRWPKHGTIISPNKTERECLNGCGTVLDRFQGEGTPVCESAKEQVQ